VAASAREVFRRASRYDRLSGRVMSRLRIAVSGTRGQVVQSLAAAGAAHGVEIVTVGRPLLDLADPQTIEAAIAPAGAQVLVSAAAYTDAAGAEAEPHIAEAVNVRGAEALALCARKLQIPIVHLSTAYVFDGTNPAPYRETDHVNPINAYGRTKAIGERAVAAAQPHHVILRTSLVYSPFGRNFLTAMLALARQRNEIAVVDDQTVDPTSADDFAKGILTVARNLIEGHGGEARYGVFHIASHGAATPAELAIAIFAAAAERGGPSARVIPTTRADYESRVRRPANARLDCSKIAAVHGVALPSWRSSLPACINRILEKQR
jgi:dTDP-4-dehydrorhamnose reductase